MPFNTNLIPMPFNTNVCTRPNDITDWQYLIYWRNERILSSITIAFTTIAFLICLHSLYASSAMLQLQSSIQSRTYWMGGLNVFFSKLTCYMLKYPLKYASAVPADAHFSGYSNNQMMIGPCLKFLDILSVSDESLWSIRIYVHWNKLLYKFCRILLPQASWRII